MFIFPDTDGKESSASISSALGMFRDDWRQQTTRILIPDWVIESMQEIVRKMNQVERTLFKFSIPNVHIDDCSGNTERDFIVTGNKLQQDVRGWLSPPNPWKNHNLARGSRHRGTGAWWIEGDAYAEWKSSGSLLWIHGKRQYFAPAFLSQTDAYFFLQRVQERASFGMMFF